MHVTADRDLCCSSGMCVTRAPEVFRQGEEDGLVRVIVIEPKGELQAKARLAEQGCPVRAIRIVD